MYDENAPEVEGQPLLTYMSEEGALKKVDLESKFIKIFACRHAYHLDCLE